MKVQTSEIKTALDLLAISISRNAAITEESANLLLNKTYLSTFNGEIGIYFPFESDIDGIVSFDKMQKLISRFPDSEISIIQKKDQLIFKGKKIEAGLNFKAGVDSVLADISEIKNWTRLPSDFIEGLQICLVSSTEDIALGALNMILVDGQSVISCDNIRLTKYELSRKITKGKRFLISTNFAKYLPKFNPIKIAMTDSWIYFQNVNGVIYSCLTTEDDYPDVNHLFDSIEGKKINLPIELKESLIRSEVFAKKDLEGNEAIKFTMSEGELLLEAEDSQGWIKEKLSFESYKRKKEISFTVNPSMFAQILNVTQDIIIGEEKLFFIGEKFQHILATE